MIALLRNVAPLAVLLVGVVGYLTMTSLKGDPVETEVPYEYPLVETTPLMEHSGTFPIEVDGLVVPYREISVAAQVSGRIVSKSPDCEAGRYVHGESSDDANGGPEPLLEIEPLDYQLEVQRLQAQVDQAAAALEELSEEIAGNEELIALAQDDLKLRASELQRARRLADVNSVAELERVQGQELAARNALTKLVNQQKLLQARRESLQASRQLAEAQLEKARLDLQRTRVYAPTNGVIVREMVEQGDYVQKGTPLFSMEDTSRVEVTCNLRMEDLTWLWLDQQPRSSAVDPPEPERIYELPQARATVVYELDEDRKFEWTGRLDRFDGIGLDERTRTIPCRVVVEDPMDVARREAPSPPGSSAGGPSSVAPEAGRPFRPPALVRGMYVKVDIAVTPRSEPGKTLLRIPPRALRPGPRLWLDREGELRVVNVDFVGRLPVQWVATQDPEALLAVQAGQLPPNGSASQPADDTNTSGGQPPASGADGATDGATGGETDYFALVTVDNRELRAGDRLIVSQLADVREGLRLRPEAAALKPEPVANSEQATSNKVEETSNKVEER